MRKLTDEEKLRRATLKQCRVEVKPESVADAGWDDAGPARAYGAIAQGYVADVLGGAIVSGVWARRACERHDRDRMKSQTDPSWPYAWSDLHVKDACAFVERLPHVEGKWASGTITLEPWQVFVVASLFGWRHRADLSRRRFTTLYLELGRKGAKSTLMAAIAFFHLLEEHEPGASVVCGATTGIQARIVFGIMQRMVRASKWLRRQGVEALANAIVTADGTVKPINAKASTQDGLNPSAIVLDESHAQQFGLHDVLKSAQGSRENPLLLCPTTAGYDLLSVGYAMRTHLTKVLEQVFAADHLFGLIYTLDEGDDWRDERVWIKANPMLGITPKLEWVRKYCADAQQTPGMEGEFRVKVCSQWMQSASAWLSMTAWDACAEPSLALETFKGQPCYIGLDLAQLDDLAAKVLVFERDEHIVAFIKIYLPRDVVEARARQVPEYKVWAADGLLTLTEGAMIDNAVIEADIRADAKVFAVKAIVADQFGSVDLVNRLAKDGLPAVIEPKNTKTFTPPARELEARVLHGRFRHDGNSCFKWQASNCVVTRRIDDSILPKKEAPESPNKIDAIDALLEAMGALLRKPQAPQFPMLILGGGR